MNLNRRFIIAVSLACCALPGTARAAENSPSDSLPQQRSSLVTLPYAFYTPETKIAFGAGSIYSFRWAGCSPSDRPSNVRAALTYTQLNQVILALLPEIYSRNERYYFSGYYGFYKYPDKFWGIGNASPDGAEENYQSNDFESNTSIQKRIAPGLLVGIRYEYQYMNVTKTAADGALRDGVIPGSRGGSASGLGVIVNHDTRDHVYQPSTGFYNQCYVVFFGRTIGSDYTFNALSIDLRRYIAVFGSHVLALQTFDSFISGEAPFQLLSQLGGSHWMRGYYLGRYRDNNMFTIQAEYRFPVWWRFGAVGFAGVGDVNRDVRKLRLDELKYSLGCGVRFTFDKRERINARLDIGFGTGDNAGVYAMVLEAF